jgi:hypothetical protein
LLGGHICGHNLQTPLDISVKIFKLKKYRNESDRKNLKYEICNPQH